VWEWCQDWGDDEYYKSSPELDPKGPDQGSFRVYRGGSWGRSPEFCRSAVRNCGSAPSYRIDYLGFRVARSSV